MLNFKNNFITVSVIALTAFSQFYTLQSNAKLDAPVAKILDERTLITPAMLTLQLNMRQLWEEHIIYTRNFIISDLANLEDLGKVTERLLKNQEDIGNAIKPIYGDTAGQTLTTLLKDHILIAGEIIAAAKAGNNEGVANGQKKWQMNADLIAEFLSSANLNWPKATLKEMLYKHLELTTTEVTCRLKKDWNADLDAYDAGHIHMLMFSDILTNGIIKQFPRKFL